MALHVAHFDLAGGKLVATQDQDELGAYLIGLLKLGLEDVYKRQSAIMKGMQLLHGTRPTMHWASTCLLYTSRCV